MAKGFAPQTELGIWWRDLNFRLLAYLPWSKWVFKLVMGEIAAAAKAIRIRDYAAMPHRSP